ncbi:hypothetical protein K435DRAFT_967082 [Dendrothele bispora CBS 962.96]|uniref:Cora-domain-containing protein n=1 Tax=Dendrothele bispora (strain CBS 962.96) TaxID=1314807 RepID=A0A4S8LXF1_DENBC|nr:hypothetical protein K435DRAFT_967082 [Dendrothele bispora CBS 962.96]
MSRGNSFSDLDGRSPDLDDATGGITPSSPTYGNSRLSPSEPVEHSRIPQSRQTISMELPAGIDPRRALINHMPEKIEKRCIEVLDYSSTNFKAHKYTNEGLVRFLSDPQASNREAWAKVRWINIGGGLDRDVIDAVSSKYNIHPLALQDVFSTGSQTRSKVDYYPNHLSLRILCHDLFSVPPLSPTNITGTISGTGIGTGTANSRWRKKGGTLRSRTEGNGKDMEVGLTDKMGSNDGSDPKEAKEEKEARVAALKNDDRVQLQIQPVFIFLFRDGTVISMQNSTDLSITQPFSQRIQQDLDLRTPADPSMLVQVLIDLIVDKAEKVVDEYRNTVQRFRSRVLLNPSMETLRNLHILYGDLILHKRTLESIKTLLYDLIHYDRDRVAALMDTSLSANKDVAIVGYMSYNSKTLTTKTYSRMEGILSSMEMFARITENLIDYTSNMTYEMNDFMRRLTLATIICLPLTLLTGYFVRRSVFALTFVQITPTFTRIVVRGMNFSSMWSVNEDILSWKIALPLAAVVVPLSHSLKRTYQYLTQKKQRDRASRRAQSRKYTQVQLLG